MKTSACQVVVVKLCLLCQKQTVFKTGLNSSKYGENFCPAAVLELKEEEISANKGVDTTIYRLDKIPKKNEMLEITLPLKHLRLLKDHTI